jgi:hypothetical protein
MWVFSTAGAFSVVRDAAREGHVVVRTRIQGDLARLTQFLPTLSPTEEATGTDYRYRGRCPIDAWASAVGAMASEISYSNFKAEVARIDGLERERIYEDVWRVMRYAEQRLLRGGVPVPRRRRVRSGVL